MNSKCTLFLFYILVFLFLPSCSSDDDSLALVLDNPYVEVQPEETTTVNVTSGNGGYVVKSADEAIATAEVNGNTITVHVLKVGTTTISVKDKHNNQALIYVDVPVLRGAWAVTRYDAIVEVSDSEAKEAISSEVINSSAFLDLSKGERISKLTFHDGGKAELLLTRQGGTSTYVGSVQKDHKRLYLTIGEQKVSFDIISFSRYGLTLKENLTEWYRIRYPGVEILSVYKIHQLTRIN